MKIRWLVDLLETLVKSLAKGRSFQALLEEFPKNQAFQSAWEGKFKALVEVRTKSQASNIAGEAHMLQTLIKLSTEDDAFETRGEGHIFQALVKVAAKG